MDIKIIQNKKIRSLQPSQGNNRDIKLCAISPDQKFYLTIDETNIIRIWNSNDGQLHSLIQIDQKYERRGSSFRNDSKYFGITDYKSIKFIDIFQGNIFREKELNSNSRSNYQ